MSGEEIRVKISENNRRISEELDPSRFTLNQEVARLLDENKKLRAMCQHEWNELGYCVFCDKEKD